MKRCLAVAVFLLSALAVIPPLAAQPGNITTIAGNGWTGGGTGVGGPSVNAPLASPFGLAIDRSDNFYVADSNRVVRVDGATGILTLTAGNGTAASTGDGGPAPLASINRPCGLGLDAAGNLFIVEAGGNRVRRVDAQSGIITTVAGNGIAGFSGDGGPATAASLNLPAGLAVDATGNLFIADSGNYRIRRVDALSGIITTVAGNGTSAVTPDGALATAAGLSRPEGVSIDGNGNLLISEYGTASIRRVDIATGILTTFAGSGVAKFTGDGVLATSAGLGGVPLNVAVDAAGNYFFADIARIRRVDGATGIITTVAGNGTGFQGQMAAGGSGGGGPYYMPVAGDNGPATAATLNGPGGVALTRAGNLMFSDRIDCRVRGVYLPSPLPYTNVSATISPASVETGQQMTLTGTVTPIGASGVPRGAVEFLDQSPFGPSTVLGTAYMTDGVASLSIAAPAAGTHQILALYSGDGIFNASGAPQVSLTITAHPAATVTVSSSRNPVQQNTPVTFTITVAPAAGRTAQPTGTVALSDNYTTQIGNAALVNGSVQFTATFTTTGNHPLYATYYGDSNYSYSTAPVLNQNVAPASSITLTSSANPSVVSTPVTFTAIVVPASATGTVQFLEGTAVLGSGALSNGAAIFSTSNLALGSHSIQAVYAGDGVVSGVSSAIVAQTVVNIIPTTLTLTANLTQTTFGQWVNFSATISPITAEGTIQFLDNGAFQTGAGTVGTASWGTPGLKVGTHTITAVYLGDATHSGSTSAPQVVTVSKATPVVTLNSNANPIVSPAAATFTVYVSPTVYGTVVQLLDGQTVAGTGTITTGPITISAPSLTPGAHSITAVSVADADGNMNSATSAVVTQTVQSQTTISVNSADASATYGQPVTFTAAVTPAAATGTVQFASASSIFGAGTITNGTASITMPSLAPGIMPIQALYSGDGIYLASTSSLWVQTVNKAPTTVSTASSATPSPAGQSINLTAMVSPASAAGSIQFMDGATVLGTATLSGGSATLSTSSLAGGSHSITAVYGGSANYLGSTSAALSQTVKFATTTTVAADISPVVYGQQVNLIASVAPNTATGTVQFSDGATALGTIPVSGGMATFPISTLSTGTHAITATYSGDASNTTSASAPMTLNVGKVSTTLAVTSSANPTVSGQAAGFTATVSPAAATGTVQFLDGATVIGSATVSGGVAAFSTSSLAPGSHNITASYGGDANYGAASMALTQTVKATTATTLSASSVTVTPGQTVQLTASVAPATASGTVQFFDGGAAIGTAALSGGASVLAVSSLAVGSHTLTAVYSGDGSNVASTSTAVVVTVSKAAASLTLTSSLNPAVSGQSVTFTAAVTPSAATGTVQFKDGAAILGTVTVSGGTAAFATSALAAGSHSVTVVYSGDAAYNTAATVFTETVKAASTIALSVNIASVSFGQAVQMTGTVLPAGATGTVQFWDGAAALGTVSVNSGTAVLAVSNLAVGSHLLTAVYSGDGNNAAATSGAVTVTVSKTASSVTLVSALNPAVSGQSVTFTATLTPASATGTMQFQDRGAVLGSVTIASGAAAFATSTLAARSHSITAVYSGDGNYNAGTSAALTETVTVALPAAPSSLTAAAASASQINLTWTASPTSGVTYNVYSSATSGFTPSTSNRIATGVTATIYAHTGLAASSLHYYVVTAQNSAGESAKSNQASATTQSGGGCHVVYTVTTQWNVGFGTALTIQNTGTTPINGWNLTWTWAGNQQITQAWNSDYTQTGANAKLTNASWNPTIAAGATISGMGFNGTYSGTNTAPSAFYLNSTLCH